MRWLSTRTLPSKKARLYKSRLQIQAQRKRNEDLVAGYGSADGYPWDCRSTNRFCAEFFHQSLRSEAGPASILPEFGANFRSDARWTIVSFIGGCNCAGSGKQLRHRGGTISPANCEDRHPARQRRRVTARTEPAGGRAASRNRRPERPAPYDSHSQFDTGAGGELELFRRRVDNATAERSLGGRRAPVFLPPSDSTI